MMHVLLRALFCFGFLICLGCLSYDPDAKSSQYSIESQLPEDATVLNTLAITEGPDDFYLTHGSFCCEKTINAIRNTFLLELYQGKDEHPGFAEVIDRKLGIPWFPLSGVDRVYFVTSVEDDGSLKPGFEGYFLSVMWVDDDKKEFIIEFSAL